MTRPRRKPRPPYRSLYEEKVADYLISKKVRFKYEHYSLEFDLPVPNAWCEGCDGHDIFQTKTYTPDFFLPYGIVIEAKGKMDKDTRKRLVAIKAGHPREDIRLLFMKNNKIAKTSKKRYLEWAEDNGFKAAVGPEVPDEWLVKRRKK